MCQLPCGHGCDQAGLMWVSHTLPAGDPDPAPTSINIFNLHSRPSSAKRIVLQFEGCVLQNTAFNNATHPVLTVVPYSSDNTMSTSFSDAERAQIVSMW